MTKIQLSSIQLELLELVAIGKTDREIAVVSKLSLNTVKTYLARLRKKANVSNRTSLAMWFLTYKKTNEEQL